MSDKDTPPLTGKDLARKPRGFPDKRESLIHAQAGLVETITGVYRQWGFEALETSAFEYADALGKFLPDDDRPNAGVFAIQDDDEQWMSLRYDLTAPLARFVAEAGQSLGKPFRRYAAGPVWRNEKPGPGRFREFWQCDADTIGAPGYHADAEMIAMGAEALRAVGMAPGEFVIRVNTRRLLNGVLDGVGATSADTRLAILRALDKLDRLGAEGVADLLGAGRMDESGDYTKGAGLGASEVTRVLAFAQAGADTRAETLANLVKATGDTEEGKAGLVELEAIAKALEALGAPEGDVVIDPSVVRGLEYYTGPVYEAELLREVTGEDGKTYRIGSIGGGGRYDDLVARFTGETVPATGFSIGISRLAAAMQIMGETEKLDGPVVVLNFDKEDPTSALQLATELRRAGIRAEAYMGASGMRPQMKYADRRSSPAVVMVGEDELAKGTVTIKDLEMGALKAKAIKSNEEYREARPGQFEVPRAEMVEAIRKITEAQK
ncbi:MAG TPA: histidine--tRNA ligase [Hyphomonas sp.]|jgi:histidyl-tRNA synthetase|nr:MULTISPECIES: histidine--tRNA ligase [unclassified Hyphomonas]MAN91028.1 histidine--tRNA ligase [Hyphomonadaceae bacterium]MAL45091.1 histidine--tRNA ligase [Hyphomonas sp.]MAX83689.1 histidine--tRNA ligase [Hyphomonas sp.]RCL88397.1 MAG: histidine--tRNA ligase [Hyphomonas sp.]HAO37492.1 histidine--tRNA ligase [Hyphomonas sp.]|tara:strand:- start:1860 stop:3341 length:1482 start_codon:yes stop_codon:yes gene_type:complete